MERSRKHVIYKGAFLMKGDKLTFNPHFPEDVFLEEGINVYYFVEENQLVTLKNRKFLPLTKEERDLYIKKMDKKGRRGIYAIAILTSACFLYFAGITRLANETWLKVLEEQEMEDESPNLNVDYPTLFDKIATSINESETSYENKMYRMLVYFYFLLDRENIEEGLAKELTDYIWQTFGREDIESLYYEGQVNYDILMVLLENKAKESNLDIALLEEVNLCLEEEVQAGNMTEISYLQFVDVCKEKLKEQDIDAYRTYCYNLEHHSSIEGMIQFKILAYTLENEEEVLKSHEKAYIIK